MYILSYSFASVISIYPRINRDALKEKAFLNVFESATVLNLSADADSIINGFTLSDKIENQDIINGAFNVSCASVQNTSAHIYSGGTATSTTVISSGNLIVSNGGKASETIVDNASMNIYSGGEATETTVINGGNLFVSNGGTVTNTSVKNDGHLLVSSGGTALDTIVDNAFMNIYSGGTAASTALTNKGLLLVSNGGMALIVLDINNIICYITTPKHGELHDENNPRCQEYLGETQRTVA